MLKQKIVVGGTPYHKGVSLVPSVHLTYDLKGEYREFEAVVGFDQSVKVAIDGVVILIIEGDGKELTKLTISPKDKKNFRNVLLNVKDVQKLKITVESDSELDAFLDQASLHLTLADAKVRKE